MGPNHSPGSTPPEPEHTPAEDAIIRPAAAWLQLFSRTLKTWRLYDEHNPTVEQFRAQLAAALSELLEAHGPLTLRFTADTVTCAGTVVYQSRSRDDQLSLVFFRDGIHALTFAPGMDRDELDVILTSVVRMSSVGRDPEQDLVMLLWDAELTHLDMQYVSAEADIELEPEGRESSGPARSGPPLAWPQGADVTTATATITASTSESARAPGTVATAAEPSRSEDWTASDPTGPLHDELAQIEAGAAAAVRRFQDTRATEQRANRGAAMLSLLDDAIRCGLDAQERAALGPTASEIVDDALSGGDWVGARQALPVLRACHAGADEHERWAALAQPESVVTRTVIRTLDAQNQQDVALFIELAHAIGPSGLDWFILIMAESHQQRVRRPLARAVAEVAGGEVDRIAAWLGDPRWFVVRNLVTALHAIGGEKIVAPLAGVIQHPDRRVRLEVIGALSTVPAALARPVLLQAIKSDDVRELSGALRLLAVGQDAELSTSLVERLMADDFPQRPLEEQRAVLSALAVTGDDAIVPLLESRLDPAKRPPPEAEHMLIGVARCLARLGSPAAVTVLTSAMGSRWNQTREAASLALAASKSR